MAIVNLILEGMSAHRLEIATICSPGHPSIDSNLTSDTINGGGPADVKLNDYMESCPPQPFADLSGVDSLAGNDQLPFRFPLDNVSSDTSPSYTEFCSGNNNKFHAAEDFLRPSAIITSQEIPAGGFLNPAAGFLEIWWNELLAAGVLIIAGVYILVIAIKKDKYFLLLIFGGILFAGGVVFAARQRVVVSYAVLAMAALLLAVGIHKVIRRFSKTARSQS